MLIPSSVVFGDDDDDTDKITYTSVVEIRPWKVTKTTHRLPGTHPKMPRTPARYWRELRATRRTSIPPLSPSAIRSRKSRHTTGTERTRSMS